MAAARQKEIKLSRTVVATKTLTVGRLKFWVDEAMPTVYKLQSQQFNTRLLNPAVAFAGQSWAELRKLVDLYSGTGRKMLIEVQVEF